jgi:hypothetical protein
MAEVMPTLPPHSPPVTICKEFWCLYDFEPERVMTFVLLVSLAITSQTNRGSQGF